ncbi:MAG: NusG domain II-containing protein [Clostridia bacterium]|nr:NusG domain II-containing protein [Clostridia bacterium]NCC42453.1 NusG domain II-containing protein [Clostridia bacterium]
MNKKDGILGLCVTGAALLMFFLMGMNKAEDADQVRITVDGETYGIYSLEEDQEIEIQHEGNHNKIRIESGKAYMEEADCPDEYCIDQGEIHTRTQTIVCLPHKLVVEVINENDKKEEAIDAIAK